MQVNKAALVQYSRLLSPLIGVGLGVYLLVIFSNSYWLQIIGGAHLALAFFLFLCSILSFAFALILLIKACKPRFPLFVSLYDASIAVDIFFVLVILYETSVKRQQEFDYWLGTYLTENNTTTVVSDFMARYQDENAQQSFVRQRTVFAHDVVLILSCFWFIIFGVFTIGIETFEKMSLCEFRPTVDSNSDDTTKLVDLEKVEVEEPKEEKQTETEAEAIDREADGPNRRVLFEDTKVSSGTNSGTDEEYFSNTEETQLNSSQRSPARRSRAEIPSSLRRLHLEEPETESDDFTRMSLNYVRPTQPLPPVLPMRTAAAPPPVSKKPAGKWQKMKMELQFSGTSSSDNDYSYSSFL